MTREYTLSLVALSDITKEAPPADLIQPLIDEALTSALVPVLLTEPTVAHEAFARVIAKKFIRRDLSVLIGRGEPSGEILERSLSIAVSTTEQPFSFQLLQKRLLERSVFVRERWAPMTVVILAAGQARRMGRAKQLEPVGGVPMLIRAVKTALASGASRVLVVTGAHADQVQELLAAGGWLKQSRLFLVFNPDWADGQASSVRVALQWLSDKLSMHSLKPLLAAATFMPVDQPFLKPCVLRRLFRKWSAGAQLAAPVVDGRPRGAPALFDHVVWSDMLLLRGDVGARELLRRYRQDLVTINVPAQQLVDIDSPTDLPFAN